MFLSGTQSIFFSMRSAPRPSCGSNGIQMVARGWPTGGRHCRLRPAGSVLKLVHHITVPYMACLGPLDVLVCVCVCVWETPESEKIKRIHKFIPHKFNVLYRYKISTEVAQKHQHVIFFCKIVIDKTLFKTLSLYMDFYPSTKCNSSLHQTLSNFMQPPWPGARLHH